MAGRTHVSDDSDLARRFPERFKLADRRNPGAREAIRVTGGRASLRSPQPRAEPRGREPWRIYPSSDVCSVRNEPSPARFRLASDAKRALLSILDQALRDGREIGALCFGAQSGQLTEIVAVTGPGPRAERAPCRFVFDPEHAGEVVDQMTHVGLSVVGEVHTHAKSVAPSRPDLTGFAATRKLHEVNLYAAIVALPTKTRWVLQPWLVSADGSRDKAVAARAIELRRLS